ncbi:hypothetical protein K470DRAFT_270623 [Piedraia hortae CBS 480.64]|uniref:VHS domain-containing protein n=1 Tax=Piedraia hortae CBS 480.64 TaxID=1314780 RepID=A0A6A7C0Q3_9PEZI|nr:hypothetical protein K470DRAFT_270623 [Piedraia hortae CBS 480.64]
MSFKTPDTAVSEQIEFMIKPDIAEGDIGRFDDLVEVLGINSPIVATAAVYHISNNLKQNEKHKQIRLLVLLDNFLSSVGSKFPHNFSNNKLVKCLDWVASEAPDEDVRQKCQDMFARWAIAHKDSAESWRLSVRHRLVRRDERRRTRATVRRLQRESAQQEASQQRATWKETTQQEATREDATLQEAIQKDTSLKRTSTSHQGRLSTTPAHQSSQQTPSPTSPSSQREPTAPKMTKSNDLPSTQLAKPKHPAGPSQLERPNLHSQYRVFSDQTSGFANKLDAAIRSMELRQGDPAILPIVQEIKQNCNTVYEDLKREVNASKNPMEALFMREGFEKLEGAIARFDAAVELYAPDALAGQASSG